jgi:hypothetical protein
MDPVIDAALRAVFGLLFLVAAVHKLRDLGRFEATLAEYRLLPTRLVPVAAGAVPAVEAAVAVALAVPGLGRPGLAGAAVLLVIYAAAVAINLARGRRDIDCGCAGPAVRRPLSGWLVGRNLVLAAAALGGLAPVGARALVWVDVLTVAGATAVLGALWAALDRMIALAPALARVRGGP